MGISTGASEGVLNKLRNAPWTDFGDFVSRPGSSPFSISPNDTLIGVKDVSSLYGGKGGSTINITVNVANNGSSFDERGLADKIGSIVRTELSNSAR